MPMWFVDVLFYVHFFFFFFIFFSLHIQIYRFILVNDWFSVHFKIEMREMPFTQMTLLTVTSCHV